ncbi:MAG TPA: 50S ribosomal protein L11 methyltransferase [Bacteroidales bacterium]|nr:50S ribosomal protein L11 methyltransferase [Bacteroidales bacterium]
MDYIKIDFEISGEDIAATSEMLIAWLGELPFDSFEENEKGIAGYMPQKLFDNEQLTETLREIDLPDIITFKTSLIPDQNWNKVWESNFEPVTIAGRCYVRAPFHPKKDDAEYEMIIEPKMSFGTAHHETTAMMLEYVLETDWYDKHFLDMGCGTGALAILASMRGAPSGVAIDNDEWAFENTKENLVRNNTTNIAVRMGGKEEIGDEQFDIILANINRNILLDQMETYGRVLQPGGLLFMSGFYKEDVQAITEAASRFGISLQHQREQNKWVAVKMIKE